MLRMTPKPDGWVGSGKHTYITNQRGHIPYSHDEMDGDPSWDKQVNPGCVNEEY